MTKFRQELRQCPYCLNEEKTTVWELIDPNEDPDLRELLLRKELQVFTCSNCGRTFRMVEPLTYIDRKLGFAAYFSPNLQSLFKQGYLRDFNILPDEMLSDVPLHLRQNEAGWRLRLCPDMNSLLEKIHIFTAGLDDRLMEVVKLALAARLLSDEGKRVEMLRFLACNDQEMLFIAQYAPAETENSLDVSAASDDSSDGATAEGTKAEGGKTEELTVARELYVNTERLLGNSLGEDRHWSIIDRGFALRLVAPDKNH
ncbi:CpXC domain-containing protein [Mageeibacillus indolicus]|uniref:CpXC domain-containing protein n=1 Tax=Mageeibacillus indolicus (strain UPII9-5) TaxID=699246 RepID=D3R0U7_MAGIU|nr:CpXC domain-containing protein [Mageeibacillus indolicus]ADC90363.1 hypothetical protein HMPREF0868_0473 [Mageeibacillus indolicus UPII9-5]